VWSTLTAVDRAVAATRPAWGWAAEVALAWVGCHLVADRLDDALLTALTSVGIAWREPEWPVTAATWAAVLLEAWVCALVVWVRLRGDDAPVGPREWLRRLHPGAVADAVFVPAATLAGAWVLAMGAEDALQPWWPAAARPAGAAVGALVALRLAVPASVAVWRAAPKPARRSDGLVRAAVLLPFAALAVRHGWPIWGWLP
jgi:hypothetical protein